MKLMFYINTIHHGGAERVMTELAGALAERGHECILVTSFADPEWEYPLSEKVIRLNLEEPEIEDGFLKKNIRRTKRLRDLCKNKKPDVLISFMPQPILRALTATIGLKTKNIISIRNDPSLYWSDGILKYLSKMLLRRADAAVFQTTSARDYYKGTRLYYNSRVIFNPVDERFFDVTYDPSSTRVVACGRLDVQKNYPLLIKAFSLVSSKFPQWKLSIFGKGELQEELFNEINHLSMQESISLEGLSSDIPSVLSNAGVYVLSSDYEGLPNALMEAMAAGVPSISTDCPCGGPSALIHTGSNGILVPIQDETSLAEALEKVMSDTFLRQRLSSAAKKSAEAYKKQTIIDEWELLIHKLYE